MPSQDTNPLDIAREIRKMKLLKDAVSLANKKQPKANRDSDKFLNRYGQHIKAVLQDKYFTDQIKEIRNKLGIPEGGFDVKKDEKGFGDWIKGNAKDDFKNVIQILKKVEYKIETNPVELLKFFYSAVKDGVGPEVYYRNSSFILVCPTIEIYENYISERPFAGVFDYILFGEVFLPQTNLVSILNGYSNKYILLAISPSTTKRDILELWPEINEEQKKMPDYEKNKKRFRKNFDKDLIILERDNETEELIKKKGLKEWEATKFRRRRVYDNIDEIYYNNAIDPDWSHDKQNVKNRRGRKSRIKKLIGPN
jgi:hypothetical protein